ncbi:hypothetical protein H0O02_01050 [Candidatus Micrarchaeota archaeon]|nr:hypothetical protein [Candidatus Micrarchaeota archaeon]
MFGAIKSIFMNRGDEIEFCDGTDEAKRRLTQLTYELETASTLIRDDGSSTRHAAVVAAALKIRNLLSQDSLPLTNVEKVEITKLINRAKVRTFLAGTPAGYETFRVLDTVSEDVRKHF